MHYLTFLYSCTDIYVSYQLPIMLLGMTPSLFSFSWTLTFHTLTSPHPHISNPHIPTPSHSHTLIPSHSHILTSPYPHTLTPSHSHTFTSPHDPHIPTLLYPHTLTFLHSYILTPSHPHTCPLPSSLQKENRHLKKAIKAAGLTPDDLMAKKEHPTPQQEVSDFLYSHADLSKLSSHYQLTPGELSITMSKVQYKSILIIVAWCNMV